MVISLLTSLKVQDLLTRPTVVLGPLDPNRGGGENWSSDLEHSFLTCRKNSRSTGNIPTGASDYFYKKF